MRPAIITLITLLTALPPSPAGAQEFDFYAHGPYRSTVPRPDSLLDYQPGEFHTNYGNMLDVIYSIAGAADDRVRVFEYGRSVEGRPLLLVIISAPQNIARLEEIRTTVTSLRDPRSVSAEQAAEIARTTPAIGSLPLGCSASNASSISRRSRFTGAARRAMTACTNPSRDPK